MASMVVMAWPMAALTGITQARLGMPSKCTVQAPQSATPQPNLVPFMPIRSRKTHSNGISGGASTVCDLPLIRSVTMGHLRNVLYTISDCFSFAPLGNLFSPTHLATSLLAALARVVSRSNQSSLAVNLR
jgi:hypothetical protein